MPPNDTTAVAAAAFEIKCLRDSFFIVMIIVFVRIKLPAPVLMLLPRGEITILVGQTRH